MSGSEVWNTEQVLVYILLSGEREHEQSHGQFTTHCRAIIVAIAGQTDTRILFPGARRPLTGNPVSPFAVTANARLLLALLHAPSLSRREPYLGDDNQGDGTAFFEAFA